VNVVLVDRIDHSGGAPTIAGRMLVPVELLSLEFDATAFVLADSRLMAFVR
jgi:hypothetical protein